MDNLGERDLSRACSDFHLLERLEANGHEHAGSMLEQLEGELAREFSEYLSVVVGGEARYVTGTGDDDYECYGCDDCWIPSHDDDDPCENDVAECPEEDSPDYDADNCGDVGWTNCHHVTYKCDASSESGCGEYETWDCESAQGRMLDEQVPASIRDMLERCGWARGEAVYRGEAWAAWNKVLKQEGPSILKDAEYVFRNILVNGGYGGDGWATAAELAHDYLTGQLKARTFVDMCWSLEHNNGCIFDKMYDDEDCNRLAKLLVWQADDLYWKLVGYASPEVQALWNAAMRPVGRALGMGRSIEWIGVQPT